MPSIIIKVAGEGLISQAHRNADVGPTSGSSVVYEILNCPEGTTIDDVVARFKGFKPPANKYEFDYAALA